MTDTDTDIVCAHERVQCSITGLHSFPITPEEDGVLLLTQDDLKNMYIVQIETVCMKCGEQRILKDDEWEVA